MVYPSLALAGHLARPPQPGQGAGQGLGQPLERIGRHVSCAVAFTVHSARLQVERQQPPRVWPSVNDDFMQFISPFARLTELSAITIIFDVRKIIAGRAIIGISPAELLLKKSAVLPCILKCTGCSKLIIS